MTCFNFVYVENKKIISLEGNLLRLAIDAGISRNEFIKFYIGNEINPNFKKFLDTNSMWKQFFLKNKDENSQENLEQLIISCRHLRLSVIWLGQHFSQVPTYVREQCKSFISFGSMSHRELKKFHSEIGVVPMKEFELLYNSAVQKPYGKFICTSVKGQTFYYNGFEKKLL